MPITPRKLIPVIGFALAVSIQYAQARGDISYLPYWDLDYEAPADEWRSAPLMEASPLDGYLTRQATSYNGLQVAQVLEPALTRLLESGKLTSEQIKALQKIDDALKQQPGAYGAALEQLAGSQNANLAAATHNTTQHLSNQVMAVLRDLPTDDDGHFWFKGLSHEGGLDSQRGSAGLNLDTQGLLLGADWALDSAWRVGVLGAKSSSKLDARRFDAALDSWHLGAYAVRQDGPLALRLGAIYSSHAGENKRTVEFLNHKESLNGRYDANSQTVFSEAGYQLGGGDFSLEPFVGVGYQRYQRDAYRENGGPAALDVRAQTQQNLSSTLGLRVANQFRFDNHMSLTPYLSTGWKHLYGDVDSQVRQSFRYGAGQIDDFTVQGASLDRNSLNLQAGLDLTLSRQHSVGLAYTASVGTHSSGQGVSGQWRMAF
ncbi:autotransporter outer membrane beta-barrel domain-containing protein [Pseudomonas sp. SDO5271_S396]